MSIANHIENTSAGTSPPADARGDGGGRASVVPQFTGYHVTRPNGCVQIRDSLSWVVGEFLQHNPDAVERLVEAANRGDRLYLDMLATDLDAAADLIGVAIAVRKTGQHLPLSQLHAVESAIDDARKVMRKVVSK